ncbi:MAG: hypothetical protein U0599_07130 [Vicinamibacteria bacterium]
MAAALAMGDVAGGVWFTNTHESPLAIDALALPLERMVGVVETLTTA